jgi:thiol:disulfide interchange protein
MSKIFILCMALAAPFGIFAQQTEAAGAQQKAGPGIQFFHGSWAAVLSESQKTGKPVFIDAYAAWCGPCRLMAANTFTDEEVGKFFNENFVCYKLDMEKGEGPAIKMQYRVGQYPTYLFVDSRGSLKYRKVGYMTPEAFIQEGKNALAAFKSTN